MVVQKGGEGRKTIEMQWWWRREDSRNVVMLEREDRRNVVVVEEGRQSKCSDRGGKTMEM